METDKELFKKNMHLVYNPMYYNAKPRYRQPTDFVEWLTVQGLVKKVYNPRIKDLPYFREASKQKAAA